MTVRLVDPPPPADQDLSAPHDREAEEQLLGYALVGLQQARLVRDSARQEWFYFDGHRVIFAVIARLAERDEEFDFSDVARALEQHPLKERVSGLSMPDSPLQYLGHLTIHGMEAKLVPHRSARLKAAYKKRRLYEITREAHERATSEDDPAVVIETLREELTTLSANDASTMSSLALDGFRFLKHEWPKPRPLLIDPFGDGIMSCGELAILHAASGLGKTFLAEQLSHAVASGEPFLNFRTPAGGVPVLIFQLEVSPYQLAKRRSTRYINPPSNLWTLTADQLERPINILDPADHGELVGVVKDKGIALLVLDPLQELHDLPETNETFHQIVRAVRRLMMRTGAAVLVVHHEAKEVPGSERQDRDAFRGGTRLPGGGKFQMRFKRTLRGDYLLTFAKVSYARTPPDIYLKPDDNGWWHPVEAPAAIGKPDKTAQALDKALLLAGDQGAEWSVLESASRQAGGSKTRQGCRDALNRMAREAGLEGWESLLAGPHNRPRFVHPSYRCNLHASQGDLHPASDW